VGESLERAVEDFSERFGIRTEYTSSGSAPALPSRTTAELLRIVQEALTNIRKHADATVARVNVTWGRSSFEVVIADNGRGFDLAATDGSTYGIKGMRERAGLIGGEVEFDTRPKDGTRVHIRVPPASKPVDASARPGARDASSGAPISARRTRVVDAARALGGAPRTRR
jgi:signal transduction histidine kinase